MAARLLRLEGQVGVVAPGAFADLLVVDGDPLQDIGVVLATWVIRSEKGIKYWEETGIVSEKVNKQLSISSCLKLFTEQMERGDKIFSQELIFRTDDPSSQHSGDSYSGSLQWMATLFSPPEHI